MLRHLLSIIRNIITANTFGLPAMSIYYAENIPRRRQGQPLLPRHGIRLSGSLRIFPSDLSPDYRHSQAKNKG